MESTLSRHCKELGKRSSPELFPCVNPPHWLHLAGSTLLLTRSPRPRPAVSNNDRTWHYQKLILHVLAKLRAAAADGASVPADAANAVHLTRVLLKHATEHSTRDTLRVLLQDPPVSVHPPGARALRLRLCALVPAC